MAATIIFPEKSVSHFNNNKNPRRSIRSSENLISTDDLYSIRGFLSYNPNFSQQKPPLLPLPASPIPVYNSPPNQKFNKKKSNDLPSKKRNQSSFASNPKMFSGSSDQLGVLIVPPAKNRSRLPKANDVSENPSSLKIGEEEFPTSIFSISPHPSSLPLPKFSLRPKARLRCKADGFEGIDAGATDDLRRLLRLP